MSRTEVLAALKAHEKEIRAAGVTRLSLFGSTARDGTGPASDIDLLAAFDQNRRLSLLDIIHIQNRIARFWAPQWISWRKELSNPASRPPSNARQFVPSSDPIRRFEDFCTTSSESSASHAEWTSPLSRLMIKPSTP
jgi:predicted nucleotidyltransferase